MRRPRRNRQSQFWRDLVQENTISVNDFIYPLFLLEGNQDKNEVKSMPGIYRYSLQDMLKEIESCLSLGIKGFCIFPVVETKHKDKTASNSYKSNFFYLKALRKIKQTFPQAVIMSDVAMDPYSTDGHDGLVRGEKILNDETLDVLGRMSLSQAEAGVDLIGPSDMMDGRVGYIRNLLDEHDFLDTGIISYTSKYASGFYGPFRDALDSAPKSGDKKTYQMNPANMKEALMEAQLDFDEGADILMVKPALAYLDVIQKMSEKFNIPIAAYQVSGEYAMIKAAEQKGWIDGKQVMLETIHCIKRAGANIILSYFAKEVAETLLNKK